jgi:hypothetical protein
MHHLYQLQILKKFACIGSNCPQTCCSGWRISLDNQDIQYYKKNEHSFGHFIKNFDFENKCMHTIDNKCSNLNSDGLCELQTKHTLRALPLTCKIYPRIFLEYKKDIYVIVALSCPEIINLIFDSTELLWTPKKKFSSQFKNIQRKHVIDHDYIDDYMQLISSFRQYPLEKNEIYDFFSRRIDLFHTITRTTYSSENINVENLSQSLLIVTNHLNSYFTQDFLHNLKYINDSVFFAVMKQKFLSIPKNTRSKIWSLFFKTFYVYSLFFLQRKSIKEAIYWQTLYMTFFFIMGSWLIDEKKNNIEHWKTIVYTFGRIAQSSSLDLTKIPAINEHTIVVHLLYDELRDNDHL